MDGYGLLTHDSSDKQEKKASTLWVKAQKNITLRDNASKLFFPRDVDPLLKFLIQCMDVYAGFDLLLLLCAKGKKVKNIRLTKGLYGYKRGPAYTW